MKIKKILNYGVLILLAVQINFTSCSDEKERINILTSPVNDPVNNYQVVVEIISIGGFFGCSSAAVQQVINPIVDAEVRVNNILFEKDTSALVENLYSDTDFQLSYFQNTKYNLEVSHMGTQIASGSATMPTTPKIKNITGTYNHDLNKSLEIKWNSISNASSIELIVSSSVFDPDEIDSLTVAFSSGLLPPSVNNFTVPGAFFNTPGEYVLGIAAYNGINPDVNIQDITSTEGYLKGYNISGAAGIFLATNLSSDEGTTIVVGGGTLNKKGKIAKPRKSFLETVIDRHRRNFKDKLYYNSN